MIARPEDLAHLRSPLRRTPVVALVGPRQCGKTTLARQVVRAECPNYFDLEDPVSFARLAEPMTALAHLRGTVVVDEVQRRPDLFPVLHVLADRPPRPAAFLSGAPRPPCSVSPPSRSLADLGRPALDQHWLRGGFPRAFLARSTRESSVWRRDLVRTRLKRDVPQPGVTIPPVALLRSWAMLAHCHGKVWNAAEPARSLGISEPTIRRYLDLLTALSLVRQLPPGHENLGKRQVKSPKVYVRDSGLLHQLLSVRTGAEFPAHPRSGASWEGAKRRSRSCSRRRRTSGRHTPAPS